VIFNRRVGSSPALETSPMAFAPFKWSKTTPSAAKAGWTR
jgi:hypothetical protein